MVPVADEFDVIAARLKQIQEEFARELAAREAARRAADLEPLEQQDRHEDLAALA